MNRHHQTGSTMIEVLVAMLICAFGVLGVAALQARAAHAEFEAYQRSQALSLVEDMVNRIGANRAQAGSYVSDGLIGGGGLSTCNGSTVAARDMCEWSNLLSGSAERRSNEATAPMLTARGCISRAPDTTDRYVVTVFWQGAVPTGAPAATCEGVADAYPDAALRRAVSATVCIALLNGDAPAGRC